MNGNVTEFTALYGDILPSQINCSQLVSGTNSLFFKHCTERPLSECTHDVSTLYLNVTTSPLTHTIITSYVDHELKFVHLFVFSHF
jgi:hypothetical protein